MKKIKVKDGFQDFSAVLDGSTSFQITHDWSTVSDSVALDITNRWGALVEIEDMKLEEAIPHLQAEGESEKTVEEDVKPKHKTKKDHGNTDGV